MPRAGKTKPLKHAGRDGGRAEGTRGSTADCRNRNRGWAENIDRGEGLLDAHALMILATLSRLPSSNSTLAVASDLRCKHRLHVLRRVKADVSADLHSHTSLATRGTTSISFFRRRKTYCLTIAGGRVDVSSKPITRTPSWRAEANAP